MSDCISIHPLQVSISKCTFGLSHSTQYVWTGLNQACTSGHCYFNAFFFAKLLKLY